MNTYRTQYLHIYIHYINIYCENPKITKCKHYK